MTDVPPPVSESITVRAATAADLTGVTEIYAAAVRGSTGTFEQTPPSLEEMTQRWRAVIATGCPYLVATGRDPAGEPILLGYAYAAPFRPRSAYRYAVECSIYVAPQAQRRGVGSRLLAALIAACEDDGRRQMVAVIGDSGNAGSIALHRRFGFEPAGRLTSVGRKFDAWLDVVFMQRPLGPGDASPPDT